MSVAQMLYGLAEELVCIKNTENIQNMCSENKLSPFLFFTRFLYNSMLLLGLHACFQRFVFIYIYIYITVGLYQTVFVLTPKALAVLEHMLVILVFYNQM